MNQTAFMKNFIAEKELDISFSFKLFVLLDCSKCTLFCLHVTLCCVNTTTSFSVH